MKAASFLESGKRHFDSHDYARAILQYKNAAAIVPRDAEPHYRLALTYLAVSDVRTAITHLQASVRLNPYHVGAQVKLSELMAISQDPALIEEAQRRLHQVLNTAPDSVDALNALALTMWQQGKPEEAEAQLRRAFERFPDHVKTVIALARVKLGQKDLAGAEDVLRKAAVANPSSADIAVARAEFLMLTGKSVESEQELRRAIAIEPKNVHALLTLGSLRHRAGQIEEAASIYRQISQLSRDQRHLYGTYLFQTHRQQQGIEEFERLYRENRDDREDRSRLVAAYFAANRVQDAEKVLEAAMRKNPRDIDGRLQRAVLYLRTSNYNGAQADLSEVLRLRPDSAAGQYLLSKLHEQQGSPMSQRQALNEALRLEAGMLQARIELSQLLIAADAPKDALQVIDAAPPHQLKSVVTLEQRNRVLAALGDQAALRRGIDEGLTLARSPELLVQDALWKLQEKNPDSARTVLEEALAKDPENVRILAIIAQTHVNQGRLPSAVRRVRQQVEGHAQSAPLHHFLGQLLLQGGNETEAVAELKAARAADSNFAPPALVLASLALRNNRLTEARETVSPFLTAGNQQIPARLFLAQVEQAAGDSAAAIGHYRKVLEREPRNVPALNNLAYRLVETGQVDEALQFAERAKELVPDNPVVNDTLGWVLYRKGLYSLAVPPLEEAVRKEPTGRHRFHLGMAYHRAGERKRSREVLQAALKSEPSLPEAPLIQEILRSQ